MTAVKQSSSLSAEQGGQALALALLAYEYALQWVGQKRVEPGAQDLAQHGLPQRFGFNRFMRAAILIAPVVFDDDRQVVLGDLLCGQRDSLPAQLTTDLAFKNAAGVRFDLVAGQVPVAKVEHAVAGAQQWRDPGAQEAAALPISGSDAATV